MQRNHKFTVWKAARHGPIFEFGPPQNSISVLLQFSLRFSHPYLIKQGIPLPLVILNFATWLCKIIIFYLFTSFFTIIFLFYLFYCNLPSAFLGTHVRIVITGSYAPVSTKGYSGRLDSSKPSYWSISFC